MSLINFILVYYVVCSRGRKQEKKNNIQIDKSSFTQSIKIEKILHTKKIKMQRNKNELFGQ